VGNGAVALVGRAEPLKFVTTKPMANTATTPAVMATIFRER
jgi:hypothetical protein